MMLPRGIAALAAGLAFALVLGGCESPIRTSTKDNRQVTRIVVYKEARKMFLMHEDEVLTQHDIDLGFAPVGAKKFEGDGKTPEGRYFIDRRNPDSEFHLSLGISYPNARDIARARAAGRDPGSDIFLHGKRNRLFEILGDDWTLGCIAVSNREMKQIYSMVMEGTVIDIYP